MNDHQKAELLLWDFATRAQDDEERAYQRSRTFMAASERVADQRLDLLVRRLQ